MACDSFNDTLLYDAAASDNCSEVSLVLESQEAGDLACAGSVLRTYRATDDCGNSATAQQVILLLDTVARSSTSSAQLETPSTSTHFAQQTPWPPPSAWPLLSPATTAASRTWTSATPMPARPV